MKYRQAHYGGAVACGINFQRIRLLACILQLRVLTCAFRTAAATVFRGRVDGTSVDCFRPFGSSLSSDERRYYYYIYIHVVYTYTYLSHMVWGRTRGRKWESERGWKLKKLLLHFGGTGRSCARGDRHEVRRKEVIIKTRWDRERGQSISSRTDARTFSFNPTGHHLSENFSIRFKERPECAC